MKVVIILPLLILLLQKPSYSQNKVVVIDTLISVVDDFTLKNSLISVCDKSFQGIFKDENLNITVNQKLYPNAIVSGITGECIRFLLDDKRGYCRFENIKSDTMHISKWIIYDCGLSDSTKGTIAYYHQVNDRSSDTPYKIKPVRSEQKNKGIKNLTKISLIINGQFYKSKVSIATDTLLKTFHGYTPKSKYRRYMAKNKPYKAYGFTYFYGEARDIIYYFTSKVEISNL